MGRLTRVPELRQTPSGVSTTTISIAVDHDYKKDGQDKEADLMQNNWLLFRTTVLFLLAAAFFLVSVSRSKPLQPVPA